MSAPADAKIYTKVVLALFVLTIVTVWVSTFDLSTGPAWSVGLAVAVVKASLVAMIFMHLKYEPRWWMWFVLFPLVLVGIMVGLNLVDTGLNGANRGGDLLSPAVKSIPHKGAPAGGGH